MDKIMGVQTDQLFSDVARELGISEDDLLRKGLRSLLESQLREVKAEIFEITGRHNVASVEEMEARYHNGTLEESTSWQDFQRLDHLEYKRDRLEQLLKTLT